MIVQFNVGNSFKYGDIFEKMLRSRYKSFVERLGYNVQSIKGQEYDRYDLPSTVYLVATNENGDVLGGSRLIPTLDNYMIKDLWQNLVHNDFALPCMPNVFESCRFWIDKDMTTEERNRVKQKLVYAQQEFCLNHNINWMIGIMPPAIWRAVFESSGWDVKHLGDIHTFKDGTKGVVAQMPVSEVIMSKIQVKTGIRGSVLSPNPDLIVRNYREGIGNVVAAS